MEQGTRLGPYEILGRLGAGGMGEVWRARDTRLGRTVAVKVLKEGADPGLLARLDREARAASSLNHPNIVQVYDVGQADDGTRYVVMEHVEGETLRRRLNATGALPVPQVLAWGTQLADALSRAHQAGIVHRDLKPENVMVTPDETLKILDFGLAKVTAGLGDLDSRATVSRHTTEGALLGTLEYMAPEQATGRDVDARADQFALGAILYEMTTGHSPFHRPTAAESLAAVLERHPEPVERYAPQAPPHLEVVIRRCLVKDRAGRYADTAIVARELRALTTAPLAPRAITAEVVAPKPVATDDRPSRWSVQSDSDKIRVFEEVKLTEAIRKGKLTGLELARRDGEEEWRPLYETRVYTREVPVGRDPLRAARLRSLRDVGGHMTGFGITAGIMFAIERDFPFWLLIWGVFLLSHMIKSLPTALALLQSERAALPKAQAHVALPDPPESPLAAEAARVRALIEKRGGDDVARLLGDVDAIVTTTTDLAARIADLEEQTSTSERNAVSKAEGEARARVERADSDEDRELFERQLQVVERRRQGIDKAVRLLDRLRVRRETAEHELKQLRLDLSRGAANEVPMPELSSRLNFIRHEVAAAEEIGRADAERVRS